MDKLEQIFDIIDHPERYTEQQVDDILSDEECRKLYQTMVETRQSLEKHTIEVDVDKAWAEWNEGCAEAEEKPAPRFFTLHKMLKAAAVFVGVLVLSGLAYAALHRLSQNHTKAEDQTVVDNVAPAESGQQDIVTTLPQDSVPPKTFENVLLPQILEEMATRYGMKVEIRNGEARQWRLYYTWDGNARVEKVIEELNNFRKFHITLSEQTMIVE
ncbi:MAG: DUF4974 domain-containing protein [Prevotella sp.]|nr:DUF4974 domain-containing protein [Prevotella sp.]